jgi:hypothetical protein
MGPQCNPCWLSVCLALSAGLWLGRGTQAAPATQPAVSDRARAETLIDHLDDPDAGRRRAAQLQLCSLSGDALPVLEAAGRRGDLSPESTLRLQRALKILRPRARQEAKKLQQETWEADQVHKAYDAGGHTHRQCDALVHAALSDYLHLGDDPLHGPVEARDKVMGEFRKAVDAGCDDPMVRAFYCLTEGHMTRYREGPVIEGLSGAMGHCRAQRSVRHMKRVAALLLISIRVRIELRGVPRNTGEAPVPRPEERIAL